MEVERIIERFVEVPVDRIVEVPKIVEVERIIEKEIVKEVVREVIVEKRVEVPKVFSPFGDRWTAWLGTYLGSRHHRVLSPCFPSTISSVFTDRCHQTYLSRS